MHSILIPPTQNERPASCWQDHNRARYCHSRQDRPRKTSQKLGTEIKPMNGTEKLGKDHGPDSKANACRPKLRIFQNIDPSIHEAPVFSVHIGKIPWFVRRCRDLQISHTSAQNKSVHANAFPQILSLTVRFNKYPHRGLKHQQAQRGADKITPEKDNRI